jgi:hypothetical protein
MKKPYKAHFLITNKLLFGLIWMAMVSALPFFVNAQFVTIPRDGFPYCEPFKNSTTRANTEFGGDPNRAFLTAGSGDPEGEGFLRLTNNNLDQRGYVFIDLPFSSAYGIKVSFEYFAYGGITTTAADGISFFMFDGKIGPSDFQIGGLGGSLGYSPWRMSSNLTPIPDQPGLKGGYIGIGFDALRNWGNEYEGRYGGFKDPTATGFGGVPDERQYYNTIAVRGRASENYQFIDGRRTFSRSFNNEEQPAVWTDLINSSYYLFDALDPVDYFSRRFKIGSLNKAETCPEDGYRKVFIDLFPVGGGNYLLSVDMLVNNGGTLRLENIFNNLQYNFPAPQNLKIGFAASTGGDFTNFHEIRNVTAQVSDYAAIPLPEIENLEAEVCVGEENLFEFDVSLTSENSFVRCVQLYPTNPGPPDNTPPSGGDPSISNCGLSNVCIEKCNPANNSFTIPGKGKFTVELDELTTDNFEVERFEASVKFEPLAGFVGTAQIYYQVLDNYGLLSEAKTITVISNPLPALSDLGDIDFPSCDGQDDGRIFGVEFDDLVAGYDCNWTYTNVSGTSFNLSKTGATVVNSGSKATFEIENINLGTYTLTVTNPSDTGGCPKSVDIIVDQELGTLVTLTTADKIICEGIKGISIFLIFFAAYERAKILHHVEKSSLVKTNFLKRERYRGGAKNQEDHLKMELEFFQNIYENLFTVCIRGFGNYSVRFFQTLAMGRIPVVIETDSVLPYESQIQYKNISIQVPYRDRFLIDQYILYFLKNHTFEEIAAMQMEYRTVWLKYFQKPGYFSAIHRELCNYIHKD